MKVGPPTPWKGPYCCMVKSSEDYEPVTPPSPAPATYHRWVYKLEPMRWNPGDNYLSPAGTANSDAQLFLGALNLAELRNTGTEIMGISTSQIPSGFSLEAVPDETIVMAWLAPAVEDENGIKNLCVFYAMNQYSGTCSGFAP